MFVIRPIEAKDLEGLMDLLKESGHGLTTLPRDRTVLKRRITHSVRSFSDREAGRPRGEDYLFVMEEIFTGVLVGVCGIISKIGGFEPYYFYRLEEHSHESKSIQVKNTIRSLHFHFVHNGPAEICSLYLHPKYRNSQNGRFLSLSRFLYMAENRQHFEDEVIAEMRGMVNDDGHSPFWDAVGAKFFKMDFTAADFNSMKSKRFIEELMPKHPIIANLLPDEAQEVIGRVHAKTEPAKRILEQEGFSFSGLVGIFEPGPVMSAPLDGIRTVHGSRKSVIAEITEKSFKAQVQIIARTGSKFSATLGPVSELKDKSGVRISGVTAAALKLRVGDTIRYATFKPELPQRKKTVLKKKRK